MSKGFPIQAKNDYIILSEVDEANDKPFDVKDSQTQKYLKVESVGENVTACKVGDKVLPYGSEFQAFPFEGGRCIVLTNDQVLGVLN